MKLVSVLERSFLSTVLRQSILILTHLADSLLSTTRTAVLTHCMSLVRELHQLSASLPQVFYKVGVYLFGNGQ